MTADYLKMMTQFEIPTNPFPGLRPFEFNESLLYFGRDGQSEQLLRKLAATRFMAVVGTSGSGKSSLVRAGLLPTLFGGFMTSAGSDWHIAIMRPSNDPLGNLARAINDSGVMGSPDGEDAKLQATMIEATLRRGSLGLVDVIRQARTPPNENLLVVADQFEELFRFAQVAEGEQYQNEAAAFVKLLLEAARQREVAIYVVLTMRSDFLGDCSLFWDLPEAINEGQYLIPRLTREQRREVIAGPIAVCGADITPRLVNRLLNDMGDNPDQLPILQHALMRTWDEWKDEDRENDPIDLQHYEAIGRMSSALSLHADEAYNELPDERSREIAEKIFEGLTEKGADNREIRRPVELAQLCALVGAGEEEVISVIEVFRREGRSFLMPPAGTPLNGESLIDISHESLIRNWERLRVWVDEEARSARLYRRLAETAALWTKGEAGLYRDPDLQLALDWREWSKPNNTWARRYHPDFKTTMNFLDESREARDREARDKEAQRRKELRRTRLFLAILSAAFILALMTLLFANRSRIHANEASEKSRQLLYAANLNLAQEAYYEGNTQRAQEALADASANQEDLRGFEWRYLRRLYHREAGTLDVNAGPVTAVAFSPSPGSKIFATVSDRTVKLWDASSRQERGSLPAHAEPVTAIAFSPDGMTLATGSRDNLVRVWSVGSTQEPIVLTGHSAPITALAFSPDGKTLASGVGYEVKGKGSVKLWDLTSHKERLTINGITDRVEVLKFLPDGKRLAIAREMRPLNLELLLFDIISHKLEPPVKFDLFTSISLSPDGKLLALGDFKGNDVKLYNYATRREVATIDSIFLGVRPDEVIPMTVAFSPDGKVLAIGNSDSLRLFDVIKLLESKSDYLIASLLGQKSGITSIAFSSDSDLLISNDGKDVRLWDATLNREFVKLGKHEDPIVQTIFSPDSKSALTITDGDRLPLVKLWDTDSGQEVYLPDAPASTVTISSNGQFLAEIAGPDRDLVKLWDAASRELLATLGDGTLVNYVRISPDGKTLATVNTIIKSEGDSKETAESVLRLWDTTSSHPPVTLEGESEHFRSMAFSPDGRTLTCVSEDDSHTIIQLWKVDSAKPVTLRSSLTRSTSFIIFSPEGKFFALVGYTDSGAHGVELWDAVSHQPVPMPDEKLYAVKVSFSPDGKILARSGISKTGSISVTLWDTVSGKLLSSLGGYTKAVNCLAFSPDNKTLATGSDDGTLKFWSVSSHRLLATFYNDKPINALAFSPDGLRLIIGVSSGEVKIIYADVEGGSSAGHE